MKAIFLYLFLYTSLVIGQNTIPEVLKKYNTESVPYIAVQEASKDLTAVFLDTRELAEYQTSHIKEAIHVGFTNFNQQIVLDKIKDKNTKIIVYCSIGVRSEKIGEKLIKLGYTKVVNLFGGLFEWKNNGFSVYTNSNIETEKVHTYSKEWSKYLKKGIKTF